MHKDDDQKPLTKLSEILNLTLSLVITDDITGCQSSEKSPIDYPLIQVDYTQNYENNINEIGLVITIKPLGQSGLHIRH